ncbi:tumor necrosis factor receptor superfamily member 6 isoform X1 [Hippocampus zosterae]|uniref:tumor necrosis factor receptor superfamily member 6 isoform X1 n=1 Tax=Hippocampus zosterae TaxID=109293 RepID=UPI00223E1E1E|nr:tumor necrosis factor receptor superfamily member 6 isoform X1 [Hippocampus zosterae]
MRTLSRLLFASFCRLYLLSCALSMQCKDSQYAWPVKAPQRCCDKCPPGEHMIRRSRTGCQIACGRCTGERYTDSYNVEMSCNVCVTCDKPNMEYESHCRNSQNAVCRCQVGYECTDEACAACGRAPGTVEPSTTDPKWYLLKILPVCVVLVIIVVIFLLVLPLLGRIRSKHGFYSVEVKAIRGMPEDEEMRKPVQEVCGKCEQKR